MPKRTDYPNLYPPGTHWATDIAWEILDRVKEGKIPPDIRYYLAGTIAGRIMRLKDEWDHKRAQQSSGNDQVSEGCNQPDQDMVSTASVSWLRTGSEGTETLD